MYRASNNLIFARGSTAGVKIRYCKFYRANGSHIIKKLLMLKKWSGRVKTYFVATDFNLPESKNESRRLGTHKLLTNKQGKRLSPILTANGAAVE